MSGIRLLCYLCNTHTTNLTLKVFVKEYLNTLQQFNWAIPEISTTPLWTTLNWVFKNFTTSKNDSSSFSRIPNPADCKSWGIPYFEWFSWNSGQNSQNFQSCSPSIFYRISNVVHRGCEDIFWNSPLSVVIRLDLLQFCLDTIH